LVEVTLHLSNTQLKQHYIVVTFGWSNITLMWQNSEATKHWSDTTLKQHYIEATLGW
jgi:hypothetical protein